MYKVVEQKQLSYKDNLLALRPDYVVHGDDWKEGFQKSIRTEVVEVLASYGGKLVENCVQAIARDCLAQAIENLEAAGYPVVFHVHDEVVIDITPFADEKTMLDNVVKIMATPIPWAQGLPLGAEGWVGTFFKKD